MKKLTTTIIFLVLCLFSFHDSHGQTSLKENSSHSAERFFVHRSVSDSLDTDLILRTDSSAMQTERKLFQRGYRGYIETGLDIETDKNGNYNWFKINLINSFQFNPTLTLGIGTGLRKCLKTDVVLVPVFISLRSFFSVSGELNPFFSMQGGITLNTTSNLSDAGYFISPQVGAKTNLSQKTGVYFSVGLEMKNYVNRFNYGYYSSNPMKIDMIHINALVGFEF